MSDKFQIKAIICIPTFNEEKHLPFLLESIENQKNIDDYEVNVFISDSNSTDRTIEVAESFSSKSNFRYEILVNKGANKSVNINKVLEIIESDVFIVIDAHCELDSYYVSNGIKSLIDNQNTYCAVGGVCGIRPSPITNNFVSRSIAKAYVSPFGAGYSTFKDSNFIKTKSRIVSHIFLGFFSTKEMKEVGGFNEELERKQDIDFLERMRRKTKKSIYQDSNVKLDYFLKQNTLREIGKRFFVQGQLIFHGKDNIRLKHYAPLFASIFALFFLWLDTAFFLFLVFLYFLTGMIFISFEDDQDFFSIIAAPFFFSLFHLSYLLGTIYVLIVGLKRHIP